jgi:hypothetical protein
VCALNPFIVAENPCRDIPQQDDTDMGKVYVDMSTETLQTGATNET